MVLTTIVAPLEALRKFLDDEMEIAARERSRAADLNLKQGWRIAECRRMALADALAELDRLEAAAKESTHGNV